MLYYVLDLVNYKGIGETDFSGVMPHVSSGIALG